MSTNLLLENITFINLSTVPDNNLFADSISNPWRRSGYIVMILGHNLQKFEATDKIIEELILRFYFSMYISG